MSGRRQQLLRQDVATTEECYTDPLSSWLLDLPRVAKSQLIVFAGSHVAPACQKQQKSPKMTEVHQSLHLLDSEIVYTELSVLEIRPQ